MSKIIIISYNKDRPNIESDIRKSFSHMAPKNIESQLEIVESVISRNTYIGVLNSEFEFNPKTDVIESGYTLKNPNNSKELDDGSYLKIKLDKQQISFNVDRFESKSLWYYQDEEKFIVSNSQLLITALKKSFKINKKAISWFLSSGSTGYQNAWDLEVNKVLHSNQYVFSLIDWRLEKTVKNYATVDSSFSTEGEFLKKYSDLTKQVFTNLSKHHPVKNMVLPLSGGNDSRLLFYISNELKEYKDLALANWGVKNEGNIFDDKKAATQIAKAYKKSLKDYYLPHTIEDLDHFFDVFIRHGDCRIDHFNAYTDQFKIFKELFDENYKYIIRGDIPFTEGLDLNDKMSRAHIGIPKWIDFENYSSFVLDDFVKIQEKDTVPISREKNESLIEWRDRLYINFRIPIVISSFDDLINPYMVTISPMMSYSHFLLYNHQKPNERGNKAHIVKLSKQMDRSRIGFNAAPSILGMKDYLSTEANIKFLKEYLEVMEPGIFSNNMIKCVSEKLTFKMVENPIKNASIKEKLLDFLKENLPIQLKSILKSKKKQNIDSLTLAYRMVLVDKINTIFNNAAF